ncbi:hypothetical protein [Pelagibius sp.]|uniref:hypothetical protein n=1 Tax=Pelagibius sp. TaxID=1931238 RepID=UPI003BAE4B4F
MPSRFNVLAHAREMASVMRYTPGKRSGRGLLAAAALVVTMFAGNPAMADYGSVELAHLDPAEIRVLYHEGEYARVLLSAPAITGELDVDFDAELIGRVKAWHAWISILAEGLEEKQQFPELGHAVTYPFGERPTRVQGSFPFSIPRAAYEAHVLEACNARAAHLRDTQGQSDEEIFSAEHIIGIRVRGEYTYEMTGPDGADGKGRGLVYGIWSDDDGPRVRIVCEKSASLVTPPVVPEVEIANLKVVGNDSAAACSVSMVATIRTNAPGTEVDFHFESGSGQKSETHTVVTPGNSLHQKAYTYRLSGTGLQTGQVRMVIEGEETKSTWENYEVNCVANDFATLLPPKATALRFEVEKEVAHKGKVCPAVIAVIGSIEGRGKSSGKIALGADGNQIAEWSFKVTGNETVAFRGKHQISWHGKPATQQDIPLTMFVYGQKPTNNGDNENNEIGNEAAAPEAPSQAPLQDALQKMVSVSCTDAELASNDPTPPLPTFSPTSVGERMYQGYICPAEIVLDAQILGRDPFEGRAVLIARQQPSLFESQSQVKEYSFSIVKDEELALPFQPEVRWSNVPQIGDAPPKQTMDLSFQIFRAGGVLVSVERPLEVSCKTVNFPTAINMAPPKVHSLQVIRTTDEILYQGRICPTRVKLIGAFTGQGSASGNAFLGADGGLLTEEPFTIEDGVTDTILGEHTLNWVGVESPFQQDVEYVLRLDNAEGVEVDRETETETFACRNPEPVRGDTDRVDGLSSNATPQPQSYNLSISELGSKIRNGYVCPTKIGMGGFVQSGSEGFSGSISYFAGAVLQHSQGVNLGPNTGQGQSVEHVLDWDAGAFPEKDVIYAFKVENQYCIEVGSEVVTKRIACEKIETNRDPAVSGLSSGGSNATHAPTNEVVGQVALQTAPAFAIQAPKGRVRAGRIQLSGGPANAKYDLRFYRGDERGYRSVRSAQLPRQMTGRTATFNLRALSGSRTWRIEVCPAGTKDKKACQSSDFQLPRLKGAGGMKAPANPATTKVFVMPGLGG